MDVKLSPSIICTDLCNLEKSVAGLLKLNVDMLHIDIIDGYFSPSMPIGLDMIRSLRQKTVIPFDVHVMAKENEFFINELLDIGVQQICFHYESEIHVDRMLNRIKEKGIKAGVALTPSTPITVLEYVIEKCDYLMLMLINPGFAGNNGEMQVTYAKRKIKDSYQFIQKKGHIIPVEIDGRISMDEISDYVENGANILVLGSRSLFKPNSNLEDNIEKIRHSASLGIEKRAEHEFS